MTTTYDLSKLGRIRGEQFTMTRPVVVSCLNNGDPIVAYENGFQGRSLVHIRSLYQDNKGAWLPGKGISFPAEEIVAILTKLVERFTGEAPADEANAAETSAAEIAAAEAQARKIAGTSAMPKMGTRTALDMAERQARSEALIRQGIDALTGLKSSMAGAAGPAPTHDQWHAFLSLVVQMSPENLTCDGELSRSQVVAKSRKLAAQWTALEKAVGRKVSEDDVYAWERKGLDKKPAAPSAKRTLVKRSARNPRSR